MSSKIIEFAKGPWAVAILLVGMGIALSAASTYSNAQPPLRVASPTSINTSNSCIPVMERVDGHITGRISCASDEQVREFCAEILRTQKNNSPAAH